MFILKKPGYNINSLQELRPLRTIWTLFSKRASSVTGHNVVDFLVLVSRQKDSVLFGGKDLWKLSGRFFQREPIA